MNYYREWVIPALTKMMGMKRDFKTYKRIHEN